MRDVRVVKYESTIQADLLPVIAQQITTSAGFQKIPGEEVATCAVVSAEEEVGAWKHTSQLRFFFLRKMFLRDFYGT